MQGQEKFILEYYKKIQWHYSLLKEAHEEKIINSIKLKTKLIKKEITDQRS